VHGAKAPDSNDEYLFYQTLIGAWPADHMGASEMGSFRERIAAYMLKATREAKVHTSWINLTRNTTARFNALCRRS
jgi:(1->4)-alpha-D-glucan 1-alpha-D-glucosylmutase